MDGAEPGSSGTTGGLRKSRVSIADVAKIAGVSTQTVSRVANGHPSVTPSTRESVQRAMRQLGYRPNSAARALRNGRFRTIGVILFRPTATGKSATVEALTAHAATAGYAITLIPIDVPTQDNMLGAFTRMEELAVDAVIVFIETQLLDTAIVQLPPGVHVVVVDSDTGDRYRVIDSDQGGGTRSAVDHLLELGHKTVWHVTGPQSSYASLAHFIPPLTTIHQDFAEVGRRSAREVLRQIRDHARPRPGTDIVPTRLVVRNSTAPPPRPRRQWPTRCSATSG